MQSGLLSCVGVQAPARKEGMNCLHCGKPFASIEVIGGQVHSVCYDAYHQRVLGVPYAQLGLLPPADDSAVADEPGERDAAT